MKSLLRGCLLIITVLVSGMFSSNIYAGNIDSLYYICDGGDDLWRIHRTNGGKTYIGALGSGGNVETMAYWPGNETIYVCDAGNFGTVDKSTGVYTSIANVDAAGAATGSIGAQFFGDIDGLSFDPWTGKLWASHRRVGGDFDLLFQINPVTGLYVADAFGVNIDYLVIDGVGVFTDIDDIAVSPVDGKMFTVSTQGGAAQIVQINKATGATIVASTSDRGDVEGLSYHNDGTFWGVVGTDIDFLQIDPNTGVTSGTIDITDANCSDPEALSALVADINTVEGTVWDDVNFDGVLDVGEVGVSGVDVNLYIDFNGNGVVDLGDVLIQTSSTDGSGQYDFDFATTADLIVSVGSTSFPVGYALTTDNVETATFAAFGVTESNNDFGIAGGPDSDGDGIPDFYEGTTADTDSDGVPDYLDLDSDDDGILDSDEGTVDSDNDGVPNYIDLDSDNDGIPDCLEANGGIPVAGYDYTRGKPVGTDTDGDGLMDVFDNAPTVAGGAGSTSTQPITDTDGDGVADYTDLDSDGDAIMDVIEAGGTDANGDGIIDGFTDLNGDGYFDGSNVSFLAVDDLDGDGFPNYLDLDSDGDGIHDLREAFPTAAYPSPVVNLDDDGDGVFNLFDVDQGGSPAPVADTDNDGTPDYLDLDSDGDGANDIQEGNDANTDGTADTSPAGSDLDNDGLDDNFDSTPLVWGGVTNYPEQNQDSDSEPDWRDSDDTNNAEIFYFICDATEELYTINPNDGSLTLIGGTGVTNTESSAYWNGVLYAANGGDLGTLNLTTGAFTVIADVDGAGAANGAAGSQLFSDIDGMSFDPWTGILWASHRRNGDFDLLFQIDETTGQYIPDAFGTGIDYLVVDGTGVFLDVDDIAVNPVDGLLYTIGNDGSSDQLLNINKNTGAITIVDGASETDVEGMSYFNDGTFYGTVGTNPGSFWTIDPATGNMTNEIGLPCGDPEALSSLVAPPNTISGTVWEDTNQDGVLDAGEVGLAGVTVELYMDVNNNGVIDAGDQFIQTEVTDANGDYSYIFGTTGNLLIQVDVTTLPVGYSLTTDNVETVNFNDAVSFNETDNNNLFGAFSGADCDGDGIPDFAEGGLGVDADGDGIDNMCDLDSDNDGIPDNIEFNIDSDADGIDDYLDLDSDNDGIPDAIEANNGAAPTNYDPNTGRITGNDGDGDGLLDSVDDQPATIYAGSASTLPVLDNDGDGILDYLDLDSDNDGITDLYEAETDFSTLMAIDANGDGMIDALSDGNNDGYHDILTTNPFDIPNTDGTTLPNYLDMDSDGDGIDDTREGLATGSYSQPTIYVDNNSNGIWDHWDVTLGGASITPVDTDGDGIPDFADTDSDNDLVLDIIEGNDANMDGIADTAPSGVDADGDGIDDTFDSPCVGVTPGFSSYDYAEEDNGSGNVDVGSSDLEFNDDGGYQLVGLAFNNIAIPQGSTITSAYIQFQTDETGTGAVNITIHGEDVDNAAAYNNGNSNVSNRISNNTSASQTWSPVNWNTIGESGSAQQTTDVSLIVQEIVGRGGWVSGNNMNFMFSGSAGSKRTAENFATLVVVVSGGSNTWGCATNTPHQDTDTDGEDDWRDLDDDGDGISTASENGDIDGNGTPDYLEIATCPVGQTLATTSGNADITLGSNNISSGVGNGLGAPDGNEIVFNNNDNSRVDLDFTDILPLGSTFDVTWRKVSGNGNAELGVYYSLTGTGGWTLMTTLASSSTSLITTTVNVPVAARYFRFQRDRRRPALDAVAYSISVCADDFDMDGIPDTIDKDDDNDGIPDIVEGLLDSDGDGQLDALDLDSDNDGIPDAVEANAGSLPVNMTVQGQYPPAFINNPANDANLDGWYEALEGGEPYANTTLPQLDSDGDNVLDVYDLDSDGDGILDAVEANGGSFPANMDANGQYPPAYSTVNDADGDGIVDDIDPDSGNTMLPNPDTDNDGTPNYLDLDSDDDSIPDNNEGFDPDVIAVGNDADGDGIDDAFDADQGGTQANLPDEDCNLLVDYLDAIKNTIGTGNFTVNATWDNGVVPIPGKSIVVRTGHTLTLTNNAEVASVYVQAGAVLDLAGFELKVSGYFEILGDFIHSQGKVNLNGTCTQTVCGDVVFYNLEVNNSAGANMSCGDVAVENEWLLTDGIVSVCAANSFTMLSSASGTAYISSGGTGTVICDVTLERYKQGCADGWISLASPFDNNTLNDWDDEIVTAGFPGSDFPIFSFQSILSYNEPTPGVLTNGFFAPVSINDGIIRGKGYSVYEGVANYPLVSIVEGDVDLGDFTFPLTYTNSGLMTADGWNLLGNPYPSAIDWDVTDNTKWVNVGCCNATYIWNECVDQYASYISSVGTNGGSNVIPSSSAFWVKAHFAGASLMVTRQSMVGDYGDFRAQNNNADAVFTMHLDGFSKEDEVKFRVLSSASHGHDDEGDALKSISQETNMGIYITDNVMGMKNSIEAFPNDGVSKTIPVWVRVPANGSYTFDFAGGADLPADMCFIFEDMVTGTSLDLKTATYYTFNMDSLVNFENRFNVNVSYPVLPVVNDLTCAGGHDGSVIFEANGVGPYDVIWKDENGNIVRQVNTMANDTLNNISAGDYELTVIDNGVGSCSNITVMATVSEPANAITVNGIVLNQQCDGSNGSINATVNGGALPYVYTWSNGESTQDISNVAAGQHTLDVVDNNGCEMSNDFTVNPAPSVTANFSLTSTTIDLDVDGTITPFNSSTATNYVWYWGDGNVSVGAQPLYEYTLPGTYDLQLVASTGGCTDTLTQQVEVIGNATGVDNQDGTGNVTYSDGTFKIDFPTVLNTTGEIQVYDVNGRLVHTESISSGVNYIQFNVANLSTGMYHVTARSGSNEISEKIIVTD